MRCACTGQDTEIKKVQKNKQTENEIEEGQ